MDDYTDRLRKLALADEALVAAVLADRTSRGASGLEDKTHALVRLSTTVAVDAGQASYQLAVERALAAGDLTAAEALVAATQEVGQIAETWHGRTCHNIHLFVLRREQGRLAEIDHALKSAPDEFYSPLVYRCVLAQLHLEGGRDTQARQVLGELFEEDLATFHVDAAWLFSISQKPGNDASAVINEPQK